MNKRNLLNVIIALSVSSFSPIPALAQVQLPEPSAPNQSTIIPQSSAIIVTFPIAVTLNNEQKSRLPTSALLAQPLLDSSSNIIATVNSPVSIQLQPTKKGVQIQAEALVIGGRVIPIFASGPLIPYHTVTKVSGTQQPQAHQEFFNGLVGSMVGGLVGNTLSAGLSMISSLSPKTTRQADIPQGSVYILTLQTPLSLSPKVTQTSLPTQTSTLLGPVAEPSTPLAQIAETTTIQNVIPTLTAPIPATATVIYVNSATGTDTAGAGNASATPYKTITYALNQAQSGTVIQLATSNYTSETGEGFPLVLKQGVTIRGDESNKGQNIVISGGGQYDSPTFSHQNITIQAQNDSIITGVIYHQLEQAWHRSVD